MALKDNIQRDIDKVFFRTDDFVSSHVIDGEIVNCIIDADVIKERQGRSASEYSEGVYTGEKVIYCKASDMTVPSRGQVIDVDGDIFQVTSVDVVDGVLEITITSNER